MSFVYIVFEATPDDRTIYPETYKTLEEAIEAIRIKWWKYLEEDFEINGEPAEEQWQREMKDMRVEKNVTHLYLEKGIFFEIHKVALPA